jgi:hypothetical protein
MNCRAAPSWPLRLWTERALRRFELADGHAAPTAFRGQLFETASEHRGKGEEHGPIAKAPSKDQWIRTAIALRRRDPNNPPRSVALAAALLTLMGPSRVAPWAAASSLGIFL